MRTLISRLLKLAEDYLGHIGMYKDNINKNRCLLRELTERNQFKLFEKNLKVSHEYMNAKMTRDSSFFLGNYLFELEVIYCLNRKKSSPLISQDNAQKIADNLVRFFLFPYLGI